MLPDFQTFFSVLVWFYFSKFIKVRSKLKFFDIFKGNIAPKRFQSKAETTFSSFCALKEYILSWLIELDTYFFESKSDWW
jgi:hypothetical protein